MTAGNRPVVFCTATNRIIDFLGPAESYDAAITRLAEYGTALTVLPCEDAFARFENGFKSEPVEITAEKYMEMLEVLPPHGWRASREAESFKMIELTAGSVTGIYARIGERYFHLSDSIYTKHDDIIARIRASKAFSEADLSAVEAGAVAPGNERPSDKDREP